MRHTRKCMHNTQASGPIFTKVSSLQIVAACSDDISYFALCMRHFFIRWGNKRTEKHDKIDAISHNSRTYYYRLYYRYHRSFFLSAPFPSCLLSHLDRHKMHAIMKFMTHFPDSLVQGLCFFHLKPHTVTNLTKTEQKEKI